MTPRQLREAANGPWTEDERPWIESPVGQFYAEQMTLAGENCAKWADDIISSVLTKAYGK